MKAVLMSIRPKWCELIASGKKTVEVRKTKPKLETPFKCYIYCTKQGRPLVWGSPVPSYVDDNLVQTYGYSKEDADRIFGNRQGKVIGEFICDGIIPISVSYSNPNHHIAHREFPYTALSDKQIMDYLGNGKTGYGWHISDLVIYDNPKELGEFSTVDNEAVKKCEHRERVYNNPDYTNGAFLLDSYVCNKDETDWCTKCKTKPIKRPPQSWCYVEG